MNLDELERLTLENKNCLDNNNKIKDRIYLQYSQMNYPNLTNKQLEQLDSLFESVSQRQIKDFGNISARNKADGSLVNKL